MVEGRNLLDSDLLTGRLVKSGTRQSLCQHGLKSREAAIRIFESTKAGASNHEARANGGHAAFEHWTAGQKETL